MTENTPPRPAGYGKIWYKAGYKYQLNCSHHHVLTDLRPTNAIHTEFVDISTAGSLVIKQGYAWDGPSGPTIDTKSFMRGSLVHDALYQMIRRRLLPMDPCRNQADRELRRICRQDGMNWIRAWYVYRAVDTFGELGLAQEYGADLLSAP